MSTPSIAPSTPSGPDPRPPRNLKRTLARSIAAALLVIALPLALLQVPAVSRLVLLSLLRAVIPYENADISLGGAGGSWITSMSLYNLRVNVRNGPSLSLDALHASYDPRTLIFGPERGLRSVEILRPVLHITRDENHRWDALAPFGGEEEKPDTGAGAPFTVDRLRVSALEAHLRLHPDRPDSVPHVFGLTLLARNIRTAVPLFITIDSLGARVVPPGGPAFVALEAAGAYNGTRARLDHLTIRSPASFITAEGELDPDNLAENPGFRLNLSPLDAREIAHLLPVAANVGVLRGGIRLHSEQEVLRGSAELEREGGGRLMADIAVRRIGDGVLSADAGMEVRGLPLEDAGTVRGTRGDLQARVNGRIPTGAWEAAELDATLEAAVQEPGSGTHTLQLRGAFLGGTATAGITGRVRRLNVRASIEARPLDPIPPVRAVVYLDSLNLAAADRTFPVTDLRGRVEIESRSGASGVRSTDLHAVLRRSGIAGRYLDTLSLSLLQQSSGWDLRCRAEAPAGRIAIAGRVDTAGGAPAIREMRISWSGVNLALAGMDLPTSLNGDALLTAELEPEGDTRESIPERLRFTVRGTLDSSLVREIPVYGGKLDAQGHGGSGAADVGLRSSAGAVQAAATYGTGPGGWVSVRLEEASFSGVRATAFSPNAHPPFSLAGRLTGSYTTSPAGDSGDVLLTVDSLALPGTDHGTGFLAGRFHDGVAEFSGRMLSRLDTLTFDGAVSPAGDGAGGRAALDLVVNDAHALLGRPEPGGRVRIGASGEAFWSDSGITRGRLTLRGDGTVGDLIIDTLSVDATLGPDSLRLDSLRIRSNALTVNGTGVLTPHGESGPLRIDAVAPLPAPLLDLLGLRDVTVRGAALSAELRGRPDRPTGSASFSVGLVSAAGVQATRLAGTVDAGAGGLRLSAGAERIRSGPLSLRSSSAELSFRDGEGLFRVETFPLGGARSLAAGTMTRAGDTTTVRLDTLTLAPLDRAWTLDRPAVISISPDVEIRDFDLRSGSSRLFADGRATGRRRNLTVRIDSLDLGRAFRPVLARPVDGVLQADLRLIDHADSTEASLRADGVVWTAGSPPERITLRAAFAGRQGTLRAVWTDPEGDSLLVTAEAGGDSVEVRLRADAFGLAGPGGLVPSTHLEDLRGTLEADVRGTLLPDVVRLSGPLRLSGVGFTAPAAGLTVDTLAADLAFGAGAVTVHSARASSGGGTAEVSGSVGFPRADSVDLRLGVVLNRFPAVRRRDLDALLSADLDVTGSLRYPAVTGTITTDRVAYLLDPTLAAGAGGEVQLTAADLRMLEENFGIRLDDTAGTGPALYRNLALRLDVSIPRNVRVRSLRNPKMDVEIMGDLRIRKAAGGAPEVFGQLRPVVGRSFVEQFGRQFEIREGDIRLDGNPETPTMDINARYEIPTRSGAGAAESHIDLRVRSTEGVISLDLTSDPPMTQEEIFTYFITGQSDRALSSGSADQGSIAAAVALGQVVGSAQGLVDGRVPLDVFQVRQDGARGVTIVGGSYVFPSLYAGFRQPIVLARDSRAPNTSDVGTEFELELEILRGLFITAEGGAERLSSFFRGRYAY